MHPTAKTLPSVSPYHLTAEARAAIKQRSHEIQLHLTVRRALRDVIAHAQAAQATEAWKQASVDQQLQRMRAGTLAQWPAGCTHLPGVVA